MKIWAVICLLWKYQINESVTLRDDMWKEVTTDGCGDKPNRRALTSEHYGKKYREYVIVIRDDGDLERPGDRYNIAFY